MLKTRVIGVVVVREGIVVQSIGFTRYLPVGRPEIAVEYLNRWGIDEILLSDITATCAGRSPSVDLIRACTRFIQVPLAVGGGIATDDDIDSVVRAGADKVVINTAAFENPSLVERGARRYGTQCMVVSIDARETSPGEYRTFVRSGRRETGLTPADAARLAEQHGAGEIFLNSIDRDGSKQGYDRGLVRSVTDAVRVPVIACGGVGTPAHLLEGIDAGASAVAAANFFHYTEHSVAVAKRSLQSRAAAVRLDTAVTYAGASVDPHGRIAKADDAVLDRLRFEYIPDDVI